LRAENSGHTIEQLLKWVSIGTAAFAAAIIAIVLASAAYTALLG
jgi:hypothetical protein